MELLLQFAAVTAILGVGVLFAWTLRDPLHPTAVLAGLWGTLALLYLVAPHSMRPISLTTLLLITFAVVAFATASLSVVGPPRACGSTSWRSTAVRPLLFWLATLGFPLFVFRALQMAESMPVTDSFFINLRTALTGDDGDLQAYGVLAYLVTISFSSTFVELVSSRSRLFEPRGWISFAFSVAYAVLFTGRTFLFLLVIPLAFVSLLQRRIRLRHVILGATGLLALAFFGIGLLLGKIGATDEGAALGAVDASALYLLGGIAAFDLVSTNPMALEWGINVFRSPLAVLRAFGLDVPVVSLVKEFVLVPEPMNVFTVFLPYFQDFGWTGVMIFFALFGWMHALLYRAAKARDPRAVIMYSISMYPLVMQFFHDQYLSLLTTWVLFTALVLSAFTRARPTRL